MPSPGVEGPNRRGYVRRKAGAGRAGSGHVHGCMDARQDVVFLTFLMFVCNTPIPDTNAPRARHRWLVSAARRDAPGLPLRATCLFRLGARTPGRLALPGLASDAHTTGSPTRPSHRTRAQPLIEGLPAAPSVSTRKYPNVGTRRAAPCGVANPRQMSNLAVVRALPDAPFVTSREALRCRAYAVRNRRAVRSAIGLRDTDQCSRTSVSRH